MDLGTCEHCKKGPAAMVSKGPMIWYCDGVGMYRPEKKVCLDCARLPTDEVWPITSSLDCRNPKALDAAHAGSEKRRR